MPDEWGIETSYVDAAGHHQQVDERIVTRLRDIIGTPQVDNAPLVVRTGRSPQTGSGEVRLEDGITVEVDGDSAPADLPLGYHTFTGTSGASRRLIVTPERAHLPHGWRAWGWAAQLYASRSAASWGIGDLGDLARVARWSRRRGAGFALVNPLGAVAPALPQQPSPYFPASRRYRNPLYLRVEDVPGAALAPEAVERGARAGRALNAQRAIDRDAVWRCKQEALEAIWRAGIGAGDAAGSANGANGANAACGAAGEEFDSWYAAQPPSLHRFATWSVLVERHGPQWRTWPAAYHHPDSAVAEAAEADASRVRFHAWLQWLLEGQLAAASRDVALLQDLPVGFDPDGYDAWEWQDLLALDASVGAPGDEFNSQGQNWLVPPFVPWRLRAAGYQPFVDTIRASMSAGGGLRVDHVMGLFRLWWIAAGFRPPEGAYVRYPAEDLLALVALESQRAGAVVVGEDLGTVEEGVREALSERDLLSYRVLWFEHGDPTTWPAKSMAAVTTHDLPTVAGLWDGSDLETQRQLGLQPNAESTAALRARLSSAGGVDPGAEPAEAVVAAYGLLARAPSVLLGATLEDAVVETVRPNIPGSDHLRANWSLALPVPLEDLESQPTAERIGAVLHAAVSGGDTTAVAADETSERA